jgi:hypothetical protein
MRFTNIHRGWRRAGAISVSSVPAARGQPHGAGTIADPGALVAFKARMNRDLLDRGIGKFCAVLQYRSRRAATRSP